VHEEEQGLYSADLPLSERLEIAMQRFFARRKLDYETRQLLNGFLTFGGVETGQRQFANTDFASLKDLDPYDRALALATHHVSFDKNEPDKWAVDFLGVAQAYLSSHYPISHRHSSEEEVKRICKVMASFYNYLLYHNVCPEQKLRDDIMAARDFVEKKAPKELIAVKTVESLLPGPFSLACLYLFSKDEDTYCEAVLEEKVNRVEGASVIFKTAIAALGNEDMFQLVCSKSPEDQAKWRHDAKVTIHTAGLEVVAIAHPQEEVRVLYASAESQNFPLEPLGVMTCKPWARDNFAEYDLPPGVNPRRTDLPETWDIWMEGSILRHISIGMKIEGGIIAVEFCKKAKLWFLEQHCTVYCSFYRYLLNELCPKSPKRIKWLNEEEKQENENGNEPVNCPEGDLSEAEGLD
jgi:hypothetical protein